MSPVKLETLGEKPTKLKKSDLYESFKNVKKSSRKEQQKNSQTHIGDKQHLIDAFNDTISSVNDDLQHANHQCIELFQATVKAVETSQKQRKQAGGYLAIIRNLERKTEVLQNRLVAKKQQAQKLSNQLDAMKEKKINADKVAKTEKEAFLAAQKMMKDANLSVTNENKDRGVLIKKLQSDNDKLRKDVDKLRIEASEGGVTKKTGSTLDDKMKLEEHKKILEYMLKTSAEERKKNDKNDRLRSIVGGGGGLLTSNGNFSNALGLFGGGKVSYLCAYC